MCGREEDERRAAGAQDADRLLSVHLDASGREMLSLTITEVTNQLNFRSDHVKYCLTQRIKLLFRLWASKKRRRRRRKKEKKETSHEHCQREKDTQMTF